MHLLDQRDLIINLEQLVSGCYNKKENLNFPGEKEFSQRQECAQEDSA